MDRIRNSIMFCSHIKTQTTNQSMAVNEEELSITVQRYPVLFDKSNKEFHRKDVKRIARVTHERTWDLEEKADYSWSQVQIY